jgi:uncharacterized damage-inducible protein DinB
MPDLAPSILALWRRHQEILLYLLDHVPARGLAAVPLESRGRDVARQFAHMDRVRRGWVHYHTTGKRPRLPRQDKGPPPAARELKSALKESGKQVEEFLVWALRGEARPRFFGRDPVRWLGYLISHESHHRGQIMLALKQNGLRLPDKVAVEGVWGKWMMGK